MNKLSLTSPEMIGDALSKLGLAICVNPWLFRGFNDSGLLPPTPWLFLHVSQPTALVSRFATATVHNSGHFTRSSRSDSTLMIARPHVSTPLPPKAQFRLRPKQNTSFGPILALPACRAPWPRKCRLLCCLALPLEPQCLAYPSSTDPKRNAWLSLLITLARP